MEEEALSPKEKEVYQRLRTVMDPEIGFPITEMGLVDEVKVEGKRATIIYHLSAPFCPPPFALHIGREIRRKAMEVSEIEEVEVTVQNHVQADRINQILRGGRV